MLCNNVIKGDSHVSEIAFFHVSTSNFEMDNNKLIMSPRVPTKMYEDEGNIPRICVSRDIVGCLKGITAGLTKIRLAMAFAKEAVEHDENDGWPSYDLKMVNPKILVCTNKMAYLPPKFKDFRKNDEYWYINDTMFHYIGNIDIKALILKNVLSRTLEEESEFYYASDKWSHKEIRRDRLKGNFGLGIDKWINEGFVM